MIVILVWAGQGISQSPSRQHSWFDFWKTCPSTGSCPDDYCRKPCPMIIAVPRCGGPNDYCRKPMPCLKDLLRGGSCDDYCRKPLPCLLCPPASPYLRCVPCEVHGPSTARP